MVNARWSQATCAHAMSRAKTPFWTRARRNVLIGNNLYFRTELTILAQQLVLT